MYEPTAPSVPWVSSAQINASRQPMPRSGSWASNTRRPANTIGMVVEQPRPAGARDKLQWYCAKDDRLVHEAEFDLQNIEVDLKRIMEEFWSNEDLRRCACGAGIVEPCRDRRDLSRSGAEQREQFAAVLEELSADGGLERETVIHLRKVLSAAVPPRT